MVTKKPVPLHKRNQIYFIPCLMFPFSEATVLRFSAKQIFLKIVQNSQKSTWSLLQAVILLRKRLRQRRFSVNFAKILRVPFL